MFLEVFIWEGRRRGNVDVEYDCGVMYCECISGGRQLDNVLVVYDTFSKEDVAAEELEYLQITIMVNIL